MPSYFNMNTFHSGILFLLIYHAVNGSHIYDAYIGQF